MNLPAKNLRDPSGVVAWKTPDVLACRAAVDRLVAELRERHEARDVLQLLLAEMEGGGDQLRRFLLILAIFDLDLELGALTESARAKLDDVARLVLRFHGVPATGSKLSFLHGLLAARLAARASARGRHWEAAAHDAAALKHASGTDVAIGGLALAERRLRVGDVAAAEASFTAVAAASDGATRDAADVGVLRAKRLRGAVPFEEAPSAASLAVEWQHLLAKAQATGTIHSLTLATSRNRPQRTFRPLLTWALWALAKDGGDASVRAACPSVRALKESLAKAEAATRALEWEPLLKAYDDLMTAFDPERPEGMAERLALVGSCLDEARLAPDLELELLLQAGAVRWLVERGAALAPHAVEAYRSRCAQVSGGASKDLFRVLEDTSIPAVVTEGGLVEKDFHWLSRTIKLSTLSARSASTLLKAKAKRMISSKASRAAVDAQEIEEYAQHLKAFLKDAKGSMMKIAQVSAFIDSTTPPPIARVFREIATESRPLDHRLSRQIVERELGGKLEDHFASWSAYPCGVGSLGQVHKATLRDGRLVAVKVQYPAAETHIRRELAALKLLSPVVRVLYPAVDPGPVIDECKVHLTRETDYVNEARMQGLFREKLAGHERIRIPEVVASASTARVLTMDFVEATPFKAFVRGVSQDARDAAGLAIAKAFYECRFVHGLENGDPHPGNFLFGEDDGQRITLIDFGGATDLPRVAAAGYKALYKVLRGGTVGDLGRLLAELGFIGNPKAFDLEAAHRQLLRDFEPYIVDKPYKFTPDYIRGNFKELAKNIKAWNMPVGWIGQFRFNLSLHVVLEALGAEANWFRMLAPYLER